MKHLNLIVIVAILVSSCSIIKKTPNEVASNQTMTGFTEVEMSPIQLLSMEVNTNQIRSFGIGESANEQMALNTARSQAIVALQEQIEVYVRSGIDQYNNEIGVNSEYSLEEKSESQIITAVKGVVNGASVIKSRKLYNSETRRYRYEVCMAYEKEKILSTIIDQDSRIRANEKIFEEQMNKVWSELDEQKKPR